MMGIMTKLFNRFKKSVNKEKYFSTLEDLKRRGLKVGKNVIISPGARIDFNYPYLITIGDNCVLSPGVRLIAHDSTFYSFSGGYMRVGKIELKENCIIGTNSLILPGVTIGPNVVVVAGSVVNKDIPPNSCVAGVPARFYSSFDSYMEKMKEEIKQRPVFDAVDIEKGEDERDTERKRKITEGASDGSVYLKGREAKFPIWLRALDD